MQNRASHTLHYNKEGARNLGIISETQQNILTIVSASLFHTPVNIPVADWKAILLEAKLQSVVPIVFSAAEPYIPEEDLPKWKQYVNHVLANNMRIEWEHIRLHELMTAGGVAYVVLKGSASAAYYPEPMLRTMGDVDFLVKEIDLDIAGRVLESVGFVPVAENDNTHHIVYHRSAKGHMCSWELHWEPSGLPDGVVGEKLREQLSDILDQATLIQSSNGSYMVPTIFHHGLILLVHTACHMINTGIGLRHLCDWAVFVNSLSDREFTDIFEQKLRSVGLWKFARLLTAVAVKYLHCGEKSWAVVADESLLEDIMEDIFAGGNFGQKDPERINEAKLITDRAKATVDDTNFFRQLCRTMNDKARIGLPAAKLHPVLLPVGWCYVGGRHILRILAGKRPKIHPNRMLQGAAARKKLYIEFHLFEAE